MGVVNAQGLAADLGRHTQGEVRFDAGSRALYATDGSNYRQVPIGVVVPRNVEDVVATLAVCRQYGAPVLPRGGGTSLVGNSCNVAVVIDFSKYMGRVVSLDPTLQQARVEPGTILDDLRTQAEAYHLTFGPDPSTHNRCTLGGMIGNNACGVHSVMSGRTSDNVQALEVVTYDGLRLSVGPTTDEELDAIIHAGGRRGEIYAELRTLRDQYAELIRQRYPKIPRRVSGFNLDDLLPENHFNVARALVGSEGTCVTILEATVRLVSSPSARSLLVLAYPDIYSAGDHVTQVMEHHPIGLEGFASELVASLRQKRFRQATVELLPPGGGWLFVEFGGESREEADDRARLLMEELGRHRDAPAMKLFANPVEQREIWQMRESGLAASASMPGKPDTWPGWEDSAVPPEHLGAYLRDLRRLLEAYQYEGALYGHFGDGCVHCRISFDLRTETGIQRYRAFVGEASTLVVRYGGSLSGEHGDGQSRGEFLSRMFGEELVGAFREFKRIWDPDGRMNPGKVVEPFRSDENLRLGTSYSPPKLQTHFQFPEDEGSFARATLRCVGVGKCRRTSGGIMCPSFMVTREEGDSTRGRARALFEMLQGDPLQDGWRDRQVKETLDLCLSCKGCKQECPVNVDMATYKAEFLSHYYEGRLRPRSAYAMGLIPIWARLADATTPALANFATQTPLLRGIAKAAAGIAHDRRIPPFAGETFKAWFRKQPGGASPESAHGQLTVLLWPDTFSNYFHPEIARAAVEVLGAAGFKVQVPRETLCCGRPLYDYGMLDTARRWLLRIMETLRLEIEAGIPIVGLEPSCVAVFRDELPNLFPNDLLARRLSRQSFLLSEFLERYAPDFHLPALHRKALVQGHCHQQAVMGMGSEESILRRLGLEVNVLDSGCCGMAGSFGFESGDHYAVSVKAGERVLLPAVRAAAKDTFIVADGFSCRTQIEQGTDRRAVHLAEILQLALHPEAVPTGEYPERACTTSKYPQAPWAIAALAGTVVLLAGGFFFSRRRTRRRLKRH